MKNSSSVPPHIMTVTSKPHSRLPVGTLAMTLLFCGCMADTDNPQVLFERGNLKADRELYEDAIPLYSEALEAMPDRADILFERGLCYENLGLDNKALADYDECLKVDPEFSDALNNKGVILARTKRFEEAAKVFTDLIAQFPDDTLALRNRGLCLSDLGRFDEALIDYNLVLEKSPRDVQTWFQRGNLFLAQDQFEKAIADFSEAISVDAQFARAWMNRGVAKFGIEDRVGGMKDLEHAHELDENIVIPDLDWGVSDVADVTTVITAKPVIAEPATDSWEQCRTIANSELEQRGYSAITTDVELPSIRCGRFQATKDGNPCTVYVTCRAESSTEIVLPSPRENSPPSVLLVIDSVDGKLRLAHFDENRNLAANASPVAVRVPFEDR